jgi:hypothetical protein
LLSIIDFSSNLKITFSELGHLRSTAGKVRKGHFLTDYWASLWWQGFKTQHMGLYKSILWTSTNNYKLFLDCGFNYLLVVP